MSQGVLLRFTWFNSEPVMSLTNPIPSGDRTTITGQEILSRFYEALGPLALIIDGKQFSPTDTIEIPENGALNISVVWKRPPPPSILDPLVEELSTQTGRSKEQCLSALAASGYDQSAAISLLSSTT
jgi:hypothetical protein